MAHSIFDERGELVHQTESDIAAFAYCLQRQHAGKLTTVLLASGAEVMFAPFMLAGKRAETALEYKTRTDAEARKEMARDTNQRIPPWL